MMSQLLARPGIYRASTSSQLASRRSRPCQLVIRAYLPDEGAKKVVKKVVKPATVKSKVTFQVPRHVEYGQDVCLIGEDPVLGEWDVTKCVPMAWHEGDVWTAEADLPHGATIEYKYVVRAAEDMGGDVLEWVPSWNLALDLLEKELTVRDCWEGESHEVLPGTLPLPVPTPAPTAASSPQEGATDKVTEVVTAVAEAAATAAAAAVLEVMVDAPSSTAAAAAAGPTVTAVVPPAAAAPLAAAAAASDIEDDPVPAEQLAGVAEGFSSDSDFRSGSESDDVLTVEDIAAVAPAAPAAAQAPLPPAAPAPPSRRRNSTEGKGFKAIGTKNAVAAAAAPKLGDWSGMATSELKQLCKERGLSVKGARRDLVARLQQHAA